MFLQILYTCCFVLLNSNLNGSRCRFEKCFTLFTQSKRSANYFRYFLLELGPVDFFLDGQLDIAIASGGGASQTAFGVGVAPGIAIPVSDHLSFVGHVGRLGYYNNSFVVEATPSNMQMGLYYSF